MININISYAQEYNIEGKWDGVNLNGDSISITFNEDKSMLLSRDNENPISFDEYIIFKENEITWINFILKTAPEIVMNKAAKVKSIDENNIEVHLFMPIIFASLFGLDIPSELYFDEESWIILKKQH